ncbi:SDR family oxidoreductase [Rhodococcus sp. IEGM 1307]|uniref:SDR family oxidoreductase n=1 Tax=Rhodococcus sp. IEGM 1307 TaxID=3047091 RepID=UPI0024B6A05D|nr:SDR family oxidoreductase [Rhodococcus sp. IEGM 1307]MDI9976831.1 SDR family oxidoreductase [Rhodococcus sp. IEGM 1307]
MSRSDTTETIIEFERLSETLEGRRHRTFLRARSRRRVDGKVVLITGGARGIGSETAKALTAKGARVVVTDVDAAALSEVVAEIGADKAVGVVADVCDLAAMEAAVARGVEKFGGIDLVLANAGIASYGSVLGVDPATFKRVLDVNLLGVFHTVRAALPSVIERNGYILVVSSLAAFAPAPGLAAYNASKAGAEHFANALRLEVAHQGVDVGSAHMSWIDTPLVREAKADFSAFRQMLNSMPGPLSKTTSVDACVKAFIQGLERRQRHVFVPGWVGIIAQLRTLVNSRIGTHDTLAQASQLVPRMDAEIARLGRSTSARNVGAAS